MVLLLAYAIRSQSWSKKMWSIAQNQSTINRIKTMRMIIKAAVKAKTRATGHNRTELKKENERALIR
jgi:hypothetical protein